MSLREAFGLALIVCGLVLTPMAWATSRTLWLLALVLFVTGAALFLTDRVRRRMEKEWREGGAGRGDAGGQPMPTDVHNYTGWRSGGRSETMGSGSSGGADGD